MQLSIISLIAAVAIGGCGHEKDRPKVEKNNDTASPPAASPEAKAEPPASVAPSSPPPAEPAPPAPSSPSPSPAEPSDASEGNVVIEGWSFRYPILDSKTPEVRSTSLPGSYMIYPSFFIKGLHYRFTVIPCGLMAALLPPNKTWDGAKRLTSTVMSIVQEDWTGNNLMSFKNYLKTLDNKHCAYFELVRTDGNAVLLDLEAEAETSGILAYSKTLFFNSIDRR